jgi:hypothetical protein
MVNLQTETPSIVTHTRDPSGYIKGGKRFGQLSNYQILKKYCAAHWFFDEEGFAYWVHSARRPLLAYCTCRGWLWWWWRIWWNEDWQAKPKYSEKIYPRATLSTTNPTCQTRDRTRAAAVGSQRLTAWPMARPWRRLPSLIKFCPQNTFFMMEYLMSNDQLVL